MFNPWSFNTSAVIIHKTLIYSDLRLAFVLLRHHTILSVHNSLTASLARADGNRHRCQLSGAPIGR